MLRFMRRNKPIDLVGLDWQSALDRLQSWDPNSDDWYMLVVNKGQENEHRTRFMTYTEVLDLIRVALEKKRLRVPVQL